MKTTPFLLWVRKTHTVATVLALGAGVVTACGAGEAAKTTLTRPSSGGTANDGAGAGNGGTTNGDAGDDSGGTAPGNAGRAAGGSSGNAGTDGSGAAATGGASGASGGDDSASGAAGENAGGTSEAGHAAGGEAAAAGNGGTGANAGTGGAASGAGSSGQAGSGAQHVVGRGATAVAVGGAHTCVVLVGGALRCWGFGDVGRLGYGNTDSIGDNETPDSAGNVDVGGLVLQVSATGQDTCVLLTTGGVRCWGNGFWGDLGYGNTDNLGDNETPASAGDVDVGGPVLQIAKGQSHTCALLATGAVRCWGSNQSSRLGYANPDTNAKIGDDESPASAGDIDMGGAVTQISVSAAHTCALLATGNVRCWGSNDDGQLGYGNTNPTPSSATPAITGDVNVGGVVTQIATGNSHSCALLATGSVRCWGRGIGGALGYGNPESIGDNEAPASAGDIDIGGEAIQIAAGNATTCALLVGGAVRCWGWGAYGQLGYGNTDNLGDNETPASAGDIDVGGAVSQIALGDDSHACALLTTGAVRCWGLATGGQLGYANEIAIGDNETPASAGDVQY